MVGLAGWGVVHACLVRERLAAGDRPLFWEVSDGA